VRPNLSWDRRRESQANDLWGPHTVRMAIGQAFDEAWLEIAGNLISGMTL
jgi:hypothetical protein